MTFDPLANDSDRQGGALILSSVSPPTNGTASISAGLATYLPAADFSGTDSFTYRVCNRAGLCATAPITVVVSPVNDPPVAVDDIATGAEDESITWVPVVSDPDSEGLSCRSLSNPLHGSASVAGDCGSGRYQPDADYAGPDSFLILVADESSSATAAVSVTVTPVEDPPLARNDFTAIAAGTAVHIDLLANDADPQGVELGVASVDQPGNGVASVNASGTITYAPDPGFAGTDDLTYLACDPGGSCAGATVTVSVG